MAKDKILKELSENDVPLLLDELKSDWPINIHAFSSVSTIQKWKAAGSDHKSKVLALNGDVKSKFIVYYSASSDMSDVRGSVHKWTHCDDDEQFFADVLHNSKDLIPWEASIFLVTGITPETSKVVVPFLAEIWNGQHWMNSAGHHLYWIPKEEAKEWSVEVPVGTYISHLTEAHAKEMDDIWPHRYSGSKQLITDTIRFNFGVGLFDSSTHELLSMGLHWFYGSVGVLQTPVRHRRKGYGQVVLAALAKEIATLGDDVHLNVLPENGPSMSLVEKCGFRLVYLATWLEKHKCWQHCLNASLDVSYHQDSDTSHYLPVEFSFNSQYWKN